MREIWGDLLSEQDKAVISNAGYGVNGSALWDSRGLGGHPALMIIDMQEMAIGRDVPIVEAIRDCRTAMGSVAWRALESIVPFVEAVRRLDLPVFYTRVIPPGYSKDDPVIQIVDQLAPHPSNHIIDKPHPSAFYGTDLGTRLVQNSIDTLIVVGNSTSGCVRATVVDARQIGLNVVVPVECVFDRIEASHKIGLLDMWMKYATVKPMAEVLTYLGEAVGREHDD